jgi:mannosyltransferase
MATNSLRGSADFVDRQVGDPRVGDPATLGARQEQLAAAVILVAALALRAFGLSRESFWTDEAYSATYAVQPLFNLIIAVLRFDSHLPLYYLQLHLWALISHSTLWLYLNSLLWSWLAVLALWRCGRRFVPPAVALSATLLFAAMPVGVEWSHNLRMYGMLGCLSILVWFFCYRLFTGASFKRDGLMLGVVLLVMTYSHVAGFLFFGYAGVYGLYLIAQEKPAWSRVWWWIKVNLCAGVLALPAAINCLVRHTDHFSTLPTARVVADTLAYLIAGPVAQQHWALALAVAAGFLVVISLLTDARIRAVLVAFVIAPIGFALVLSYALQPVWIDRMFLSTTPFLALAMGRGVFIVGEGSGRLISDTVGRIAIGCAATVLTIGLAGGSGWAATHNVKLTNYRAATQEIRAALQPGDVILVPEADTFWGIAWYFVGPHWGSPLSVADPSDFSEKWTKILHRLGPVWRRRLDLEPRTRMLSYDRATLVVGSSMTPIVTGARRVWLVNEANLRHPPVKLPGFVQRERADFGRVTVQLLTRPSAS